MTVIKGRNSKGQYEKDGKMFVSVTTLQRDLFDVPIYLLKWYCKLGFDEAMKIFKMAGAYGTALHHAFDTWFFKRNKTQLVTDSEFSEYSNRIRAIQGFIEKNKLETVAGEQTLFDEENCVAGTCDAVFKKDSVKEIWFFDWKSGKEKRFKETMQVAEYANMFMCMHPEYNAYKKVMCIVYVGKEDSAIPEIKIYQEDVINYAIRMFKACAELHRYKAFIENL